MNLIDKYEEFLASKSPSVTAAKFILAAAAIGGVFFIGAAAPGIAGAMKLFGDEKRYSKKQYSDALNNLKRRKLIRIIEDKNGQSKVELTLEGKKKIRQFSIDALKIEAPRKWDGKWRVLIFDIPTTKFYNNARNALRYKIKELDFYQLQKSVWIHPFPCEGEILFVAETYNVQKHIEILTVEKLLHENLVRAKFRKIMS